MDMEDQREEPVGVALEPDNVATRETFARSNDVIVGVIVDACEGHTLLEALYYISCAFYNGKRIIIDTILTTHHHWDHQAGNRMLINAFDGKYGVPGRLRVYGNSAQKVSQITNVVKHSDVILVRNLKFHVLGVPCHTKDSLIFVLGTMQNSRDCVFTGDTMFLGACGAPFEGSYHEMYRCFWIIRRYCQFNSLIFPGHEYTLTALGCLLASSAPNTRNMFQSPPAFFALAAALYRAVHLRSQSTPIPTVPYPLSQELIYNPYFTPITTLAKLLFTTVRYHPSFRSVSSPFRRPPVLERVTKDATLVPRNDLPRTTLISTEPSVLPTVPLVSPSPAEEETDQRNLHPCHIDHRFSAQANLSLSSPILVIWTQDFINVIRELLANPQDSSHLLSRLLRFFDPEYLSSFLFRHVSTSISPSSCPVSQDSEVQRNVPPNTMASCEKTEELYTFLQSSESVYHASNQHPHSHQVHDHDCITSTSTSELAQLLIIVARRSSTPYTQFSEAPIERGGRKNPFYLSLLKRIAHYPYKDRGTAYDNMIVTRSDFIFLLTQVACDDWFHAISCWTILCREYVKYTADGEVAYEPQHLLQNNSLELSPVDSAYFTEKLLGLKSRSFLPLTFLITLLTLWHDEAKFLKNNAHLLQRDNVDAESLLSVPLTSGGNHHECSYRPCFSHDPPLHSCKFSATVHDVETCPICSSIPGITLVSKPPFHK